MNPGDPLKFDEQVINAAKKKILKKLFFKHIIGGKHTSFENIRKSFDRNEYPIAEEAINELVREGFLVWHPTSYGKQCSIKASSRNSNSIKIYP